MRIPPLLFLAALAFATPCLAASNDDWPAVEGTRADTAATNSTGSWTVNSLLKGLFNKLGLNFGTNGELKTCAVDQSGNCDFNPVPVVPSQGAPTGSTQLTCSSGNVANANAVCTLAGTAGKTTYITGFRCQAAGSTAALIVGLTVAGIITGTQTYTFVFPAGATVVATPVGREFSIAVPASSSNTAIVVTLPAGGTGNTNASCDAEGYQL